MYIVNKRFIYILLATTIFASGSSINWHELLSKKEFTKIDKELNSIKEAILKNPAKEEDLLKAFKELSYDKNLEENVKAYVKNKPNSPFSHILLGKSYLSKGINARGARWAHLIPKENFEKMKEFLKEANREFLASLKIDSKIPTSYANLIVSYALTGDRDKKDKIYQNGLREFPDSYMIRIYYLNFSLVKWGGGFEKIETILEESRKHYKNNPLLKRLEGFTEYAKADYYLKHKKEPKKALEYINRALKVSNRLNYHELKGDIYHYELNDYKKALEEYNIILKKTPFDFSVLEKRANVYLKLKQYKLAYEDAEKILSYNNNYSYAHYVRGIHYYTQGEYELAVIDFLDSLNGLSSTVSVKKYLGYSYYAQKDYSQATKYLQEALDEGSKDSSVAYYLTVSQWHNRDCKFVDSAYRYKSSCTKMGNCNQEWLDWSIKSANYAKDNGVCQ